MLQLLQEDPRFNPQNVDYHQEHVLFLIPNALGRDFREVKLLVGPRDVLDGWEVVEEKCFRLQVDVSLDFALWLATAHIF